MKMNKNIQWVGTLLFLTFCLSSFVGKNDKPTLFIIGDSTVKNGQGNGSNGQWGWGSFIADYFDLDQINIRNKALGGTSSRTFYNNPKLWQQVLDSIRPGDYVIMQFGHNDSSPIVDTLRARGTIKGNGDEYQEVYNPLLKQHEMVYSYGFYLRQFVKNVQDKGASAIICSPIPRNAWADGHVRKTDYAIWAKEAALQSHASYIPLNELIISEYEKLGKDAVEDRFFEAKDATHTIRAGAIQNATILVNYLTANRQIGLAKYITKP